MQRQGGTWLFGSGQPCHRSLAYPVHVPAAEGLSGAGALVAVFRQLPGIGPSSGRSGTPTGEDEMSVAKVSEISATSTTSFEDAIKEGIARANKTLRKVRSAWIKEQHVRVSDDAIAEYQVNMMVTFIIDD
jgi:dodecin